MVVFLSGQMQGCIVTKSQADVVNVVKKVTQIEVESSLSTSRSSDFVIRRKTNSSRRICWL